MPHPKDSEASNREPATGVSPSQPRPQFQPKDAGAKDARAKDGVPQPIDDHREPMEILGAIPTAPLHSPEWKGAPRVTDSVTRLDSKTRIGTPEELVRAAREAAEAGDEALGLHVRSEVFSEPQHERKRRETPFEVIRKISTESAAALKREVEKSEFWISLVSAAGAAGTAAVSTPGAAVWFSIAMVVLNTAIYAYARTPLAAHRPGVRTKAFWLSLGTIALSVVAAMADLRVPGLPDGLSRFLSIASAGITAGGYTVLRYRKKVHSVSDEKEVTSSKQRRA